MNENVDLTKILKDCPKGWIFYSSIYGYVTFLGIENNSEYPIKFFLVDKDNIEKYGSITKQGLYAHYYKGECTFFPSREQRDWSKFTAPWIKKERFDPKTLKPFDKVLVRDDADFNWACDLFSYILDGDVEYKYKGVGCLNKYCIPYNDDTKHLVGTKDEAPEFYKYWED